MEKTFMEKAKIVLAGVAVICTAIILIHYITSRTDFYKGELKDAQRDYAHYKDSVSKVIGTIHDSIDIVQKSKDKIKWRIVEVPVYRSNIFNLPDSSIAIKADSTYLASNTFVNDSTKTFISTKSVVIVDSLKDTTRTFFVHRNVLVDYIVTGYELKQYKDLNIQNEKLILLKNGEILTLSNAWKDTEKNFELQKTAYSNIISSQENSIKFYKSTSVGIVAAGTAYALKGTPIEIIVSGAAGFGVTYVYGTIKNWIF